MKINDSGERETAKRDDAGTLSEHNWETLCENLRNC